MDRERIARLLPETYRAAVRPDNALGAVLAAMETLHAPAEAALDDLNIDRFLQLVRRYSDRAQFIVVTHQKRTMDAADRIYGVSMGGDGVSRVVSRQLSGTGESLFDQAVEPDASAGAA